MIQKLRICLKGKTGDRIQHSLFKIQNCSSAPIAPGAIQPGANDHKSAVMRDGFISLTSMTKLKKLQILWVGPDNGIPGWPL